TQCSRSRSRFPSSNTRVPRPRPLAPWRRAGPVGCIGKVTDGASDPYQTGSIALRATAERLCEPRPSRREIARPILRLATRFTRRTRMTASAIALACMVLVGALTLADGLANGIGSAADRIGSGPAAYSRGRELLASESDANV